LSATAGRGRVSWIKGEDGSAELVHVHGVDAGATQDLSKLGAWVIQCSRRDGKPLVADAWARIRVSPDHAEDWRWPPGRADPRDEPISGALLVFKQVGRHAGSPGGLRLGDAHVADLVTSIASLADIAAPRRRRRSLKRPPLHELERQLRHAEKLASWGSGAFRSRRMVRNPVAAITGFAKRVLKSLPPKDPIENTSRSSCARPSGGAGPERAGRPRADEPALV